MEKLWNVLDVIGNVCLFIIDLWQLSIVPIALIICGVLNAYPWWYYLISIGIYIVVFVVLEMVIGAVFRALEKAYTPIVVRKFKKYIHKEP